MQTPIRRTRPYSRLALAGAGALVLFTGAFGGIGLRGHRSPRDILVATYPETRPGEGRLVGFPHAPPGSRGTGARETRRELLRELDSPEKTRDAESLAGRGAVELLSGHPDDAVRWLTRATRQDGLDARWWNDLAVSELSAAKAAPRRLILALAAVDRALDRDANLLEARFNRAVTLEHLGLRNAARQDWDRYLETDSNSLWAAEIRSRQARREAAERDLWRIRQLSLREAALQGDRQRIEEIVGRIPQPARLYGEEELLAEWATATKNGDGPRAAAALRTARAIGEALLGRAGDRMLLESVEAIERREPGTTVQRHLIEGHIAYREGLARMAENRYGEAGAALSSARDALETTGSPFSAWARFQLALRDYRTMDAHARALDELASLEDLGRGQSFKSLRARAAWLTGTLLIFQARPSESLAAYRRSLDLFQELEETAYTATLQALVARNLEFLGDSEGAWHYRIEALRGAAAAGEPVRQGAILGEASWAALDLDQPTAALALQEEAIQILTPLDDPAALAPALRQRAAILDRLGNSAGALRDLAAAEEQVQRLPDEGDRRTALYEIRSVEAKVRLATDPAGALASLDRALADATDRYFAATLRVDRARAHRRLGNPRDAEDDLREALAEIEHQRGEIAQAPWRLTYFEQARQAYEEMVDLQLLNGRGAEAALGFAERGRARWLADRLAELFVTTPLRIEPDARPLSIPELRRQIPDGVTAIEFLVREDRTLAWVVRRDGILLESLRPSRKTLQRQIGAWRDAIASQDDKEARRIASDLYRGLLQPLTRYLRPQDALVFIPDASLHALPLDALVDPASGRFVAQDRVTFVTPSLQALAACLRRAGKLRGLAPGLLAVAEPRYDRTLFPKLRPLRFAEQEAREIASLYHGNVAVLAGPEATRSAFLREASRHAIVHVTGHALLHPDDPFRSTLVLAPDPLDGHSGALYTREILGTGPWQTRLAVLSACSTAAGPVWHSEGVISLVSPLLSAGVPVVVASLWNVNDRTTRPLMVAFHRYLQQGEEPANALRAAKLEMLASRDPALRSPRTWAAFQAIGAGVSR